MSGQGKEGEDRKVTKSPYFANKYGRPVSAGEARADGEADGGVAQEHSARLWYALAHALAEKALSDFDRGDA